jgi:hypothetical protein
MTTYDDARQAPPYDVPCWFDPETVNVTDIGRIVTPAHYWTQLEPNGPVLKAPDLATLQQKCEDATGLFVKLYPEDEG